MPDKTFLDTNIIVYAHDSVNSPKPCATAERRC